MVHSGVDTLQLILLPVQSVPRFKPQMYKSTSFMHVVFQVKVTLNTSGDYLRTWKVISDYGGLIQVIVSDCR
jgi:hypothetical protein